jgi:hypothetical protein
MIIEERKALAVRSGLLRPRSVEPRGLVIHTTGSGPWRRYDTKPERFGSPYEAAGYIYERISKYSGHYLVSGDSGAVSRLVHPDLVAWHVGSKGSWRYRLPGWDKNPGLGWWRSRHPGLKSPRGLLDGTLWSPKSANVLTIGIEVSPPREHPRAPWSTETWKALNRLCKHLGNRYGIPIDSQHVLTHSDVHPLARITKAGAPWDPAPRQWTIDNARIQLDLTS